ncbi:MAG TPA: protein translocase subunit SecF [Woeseiaceae bacterium]|nr:protein translocase subunit SecF [Woeseiaceae bacterium]
MKWIKEKTTIDFLSDKPRRIALTIAAVSVIVSIAAIAVKGLEFGIDFTGGVLIEVGYPEPADVDGIRDLMEQAGIEDVQVQRFGQPTDVLLRLPSQPGTNQDEFRDRLSELLAADHPGVEVRRVEFVGPQVGADLREKGATAMIYAMCMIFVYVMFRFQWKFAVGSVVGLVHDTIIVIGFFAIFGWQFDLTVLAAVLAVIGYSLNDTVVVFDRVRENFLALRGRTPEQVLNQSVNDTLSRTIMTGFTTLLVLLALYFLGGETLKPFSLALIIGVLVGTFSSVYVASAAAMLMDIKAQDLVPSEKDKKLIDDLP